MDQTDSEEKREEKTREEKSESEDEKETSKKPEPTKKEDEEDEDLYDSMARKLSVLKERVTKEYHRGKFNQQFTTLEDFQRMPPSLKRVVVIGCTGAGKSTLLNKLAGNRFTLDDNYVGHWEQDQLFESQDGVESVTQITSFANIHWMGDEAKGLTVVDTPGHDDSAGGDISQKEARDKLGEIAADLHNKLKAMERVDAILVIHNDPVSNRLNPATYTILQMVNEKFKKANSNVWDCVCLAYSKCDASEKNWRQRMDPWCQEGKLSKQKEMRQTIRSKFPECETDVPVFCLSGWHEKNDDFGDKELARMWDFFTTCKGVDTTHLQPFEGIDRKFEKIIAEKDKQQALMDAMEAQNTVVLSFFALIVFVMWRALFIPRFLSIFVLDLPGPLDDLLLFIGLAQFIGFTKVTLSIGLFYNKWLKAKIDAGLESIGIKKKEKEE